MTEEYAPELYDYVIKDSGEARYEGWVVSVYKTRKNGIRCVVDVEPQGFQMICSPKLLTLLERVVDE